MAKKRIVYHYCSIETFYAIISNKCLRLSDLNKTNDYMEKKWTLKLIDNVLIKTLEDKKINIDIKEEFWYSDEINSHLDYFRKSVQEYLNEDIPVLITCFSKDKDLLSQWRSYGDDGKGIAIGFDLDILENLIKSRQDICIDDVVYDLNDQEIDIQYAIGCSLNYIMNGVKLNNISEEALKEYFDEEFETMCEVLPENLKNICCFIKNPAFREEQEVRIVYHPGLRNSEYIADSDKIECFNKCKEAKKFIIKPVKFNVNRNKIIAFADLDFSYYVKQGLISEIVIGPKSSVLKSDIIYFLLANEYSINELTVINSEATYR